MDKALISTKLETILMKPKWNPKTKILREIRKESPLKILNEKFLPQTWTNWPCTICPFCASSKHSLSISGYPIHWWKIMLISNIKIILIMKELEHRIYFKMMDHFFVFIMIRIYSLKFLDNKKYNDIRNQQSNDRHHSKRQCSQNIQFQA